MELTRDKLMGGKVTLVQPKSGYRAAVDPVLLAASVPAEPGQRVLDLGCGAGAISFCLMKRVADLEIVGVERDPVMAELAVRNADLNGIPEERFSVEIGDLAQLSITWQEESFDQVVFNPPYLTEDRADPSPVPGKAAADVEGETTLEAWTARAGRCLKRRGRVTLVHRADRLADVLRALTTPARGHEQDAFGEITVFPLWPKQRVDAKRILVTARKGVRTPLRLASGLFLHDGEGEFTSKTDAILRGGALDLQKT